VRSHDWIDARSLALHEAVAAKIEVTPALLDIARGNLARWLSENPSPAPYKKRGTEKRILCASVPLCFFVL
jgi:hypothetical protein